VKFLLDTNICIAWLKGKDLKLREKIIEQSPESLVTCSIVKAELVFGAQKSQNRVKAEHVLASFFAQMESYTFDDESAGHYARIRAFLESNGTPIGNNDLMIASIAVQQQLTLITRNQKEFGKIPALHIESW
jgi:tRNA(fMet)-specific endonuclease VapC